SYLFFVLHLRQPRSTLFPYTTLFRSEPVLISGFETGGQLMVTTDVENYPGFAAPVQGPWLMEQMRLQAENVGTRLIAYHIVEAEDRKSTRLNSSHVSISYAVFCLKKK